MSEREMRPQVTYDEETEAGYVHLTSGLSQLEECVSYTEELRDHLDILLDFNDKDQLIGIEFLSSSADKIRLFEGSKAIFIKKITCDNDGYYSFQVHEGDANKNASIWLEKQQIVFLFEDEAGSVFLGIEIHDDSFYDEEYLVGSRNEFGAVGGDRHFLGVAKRRNKMDNE